jgi:hypothetical protein
MASETDQSPRGRSFADAVEAARADVKVHAVEYGRVTIPSGAAAQPKHEPAYVAANTLSQIYETTIESFGKSPPPPPPPEKPVVQPSTKMADVSRELKLRASHTVNQLIEIRKRFAKGNHPDRVPAVIREAATVRMGIANMLIDEAIAAADARAPKA